MEQSYAQMIQEMLADAKRRERCLLTRVTRHGDAYKKALEIKTDEDLDRLMRHQRSPSVLTERGSIESEGLPPLDVDGSVFMLTIRRLREFGFGSPYYRKTRIMAVCLSNPSLNETLGKGDQCMNAIPDGWHARLLAKIKHRPVLFGVFAEDSAEAFVNES